MPQPVSYNPGTPVSGSIQENNISYVVDGQQRNYRGGFGGLSWMSEVPAENNVIFIGNSTSLGRGPANIPLFYPAYNNSSANIVYAANTLPGSPRNFTTTGSAYNWAVTNNFFINNSNNPIPRIDADGLSFYVDANQPTSYPQTGTSWYDLSGFNRNSTLTNGPTFNSNGWIEFDGADDRSTTSFGSLSNNESHEAWVYSKGNVSTYNMFMAIVLPYYGFFNGNTFIVQDFINGTQVGYYTGTLSLNRWYHFLNTRSYNGTNTTLTTYINGTLSNQSTYSGAPSVYGGTWTLGNWDVSVGASYPFYGDISGVKLYTKALTLTEVKQNYFQSNIVTDGLVFMVDANNLVSYPKSGTTWYNLTGSSGNALLYNGPTYVPQYGGGINRDNTDDFISASISNSPTTNYSVETWFKANPLTGANYNALISAWNYPIGAGGWEFQFYNGALGVHPTYTVAYTPNTVAHAVYTQNGTETKIYLNGVLQQTSITSGVTLNNGSIGIGNLSAPGYGGYNLEGTFYNVRLYNKTLSSDEVQQNYKATKDKFQGQQIITNGLVLNLDAANKDSYPGTGTTWYDLSGNGNNGTLLNGVGFNPYQNGGTLTFDGVDDYVSIPDINFTTATIDIWVYINAYSAGGAVFVYQSSNGFEVWSDLSGFIRYNKNPSTGLTSGPGFTLNSWNNIVATSDGTVNKLYLNSTNIGSTNGGIFDNTSGDIRISGYGGYMVNGRCSILRMYNRALTNSEIAQNYNATKTRFGL